MHVRERITVYLHTKCEMSSFVRTKDMTWAPKKLDMGHVILTTPTWGTVSHQSGRPNTSHGQLVYKI